MTHDETGRDEPSRGRLRGLGDQFHGAEGLLGMSPAEEAKLFRENDERERALYGDLREDMLLLRRKGFGVWWVSVGTDLNVGNATLSVAEFKAMAARYRAKGNQS